MDNLTRIDDENSLDDDGHHRTTNQNLQAAGKSNFNLSSDADYALPLDCSNENKLTQLEPVAKRISTVNYKTRDYIIK